MTVQLDFGITPQPDEASCGPTCLHSVYRYHGDKIPLERVVAEVEHLAEGGTLSVQLALHALKRGYEATTWTCNLHLFDPTWFEPGAPPLAERLRAQMAAKGDPKLHVASATYLDYLDRGGRILMEDLTPELIYRILEEGAPIIAGLSATWLYRCARDRPTDVQPDDVRGEPTGHFVVLHGIDRARDLVKVADPWGESPNVADHLYEADVHRVIAAILLGIVTYDAKLLVITPSAEGGGD